ncbi:MAG TPA: serine/threonine-protein kinase [Ktedonobacteraceae bacterium]|nr:serine/threonine-protein kinase [Ktedonobacteraceae bacterium]
MLQQQQITLPVGATVRDTNGDRYAIEGLLGIGGFGAVYLVRSRNNKDQLFALKEVIDPNRRDHERFMFESEVLKRLDHRALPHVYRVFENEKLRRIYMLMKYVPGRNLEDLLKEQPEQCFSLPLTLAIIAPIIDALIYMHHQEPPIVHRDIKPANIVVPSKGEEAVLIDFGIAKEYVAEKTTTIIRHGSPGYAALEQYGAGTTPRTDIYALGATIYTLLTGTVPPDAITRVTEQKNEDPLTPLIFLAPTLPLAVADTVQRAMSINSADRFATVEEFWHELLEHAETSNTPGEQAKVQEQLHSLVKKSVSTRLLHPVPEQELEQVRLTAIPYRPRVSIWRRRKASLIMGFALLFVLIISMSLSFLFLRNSDALSSQHIHPGATAIVHGSPSAGRVTPQSTPSASSSIYPTLASTYTGRIGDLLSNETTNLHLSAIQQNQGHINGFFQGLGLAGPFQGTVTPSESIHFTVEIYNGSSTLSFEGNIKIGGDMAGNFSVLNQSGQATGESGVWNVARSS